MFFIAILFLPGTLIHELAHLLVAKALFVQTGNLDIFPTYLHEESKIKMGSAEIAHTDPIRRSLIGIAPILVGLTLIITLVWLFGSSLDFRSLNFSFWRALLLLYFTFVIGNTFVSSDKDLEGVGAVLATLVVIVSLICVILYFTGSLNSQIVLELYQRLYTAQVSQLFFQSTYALTVPLIVNLSFLGIFRFIKK